MHPLNVQHYLDITLHPQSINTTLNSTVNFTCEAVVDLIDFKVNTNSADIVDVLNKGFIQQSAYTLIPIKIVLNRSIPPLTTFYKIT